jgi:hypothetical protein
MLKLIFKLITVFASVTLLFGCSAINVTPGLSEEQTLAPAFHKPPKIKYVSISSPLIGTWVGTFMREETTITFQIQIRQILKATFRESEIYQLRASYRVSDNQKLLSKGGFNSSISYTPPPPTLNEISGFFRVGKRPTDPIHSWFDVELRLQDENTLVGTIREAKQDILCILVLFWPCDRTATYPLTLYRQS